MSLPLPDLKSTSALIDVYVKSSLNILSTSCILQNDESNSRNQSPQKSSGLWALARPIRLIHELLRNDRPPGSRHDIVLRIKGINIAEGSAGVARVREATPGMSQALVPHLVAVRQAVRMTTYAVNSMSAPMVK